MPRDEIQSSRGPGAGCLWIALAFVVGICMVVSANRVAGDKELCLRVDKLEARVQALEKKVTDIGDRASEADLIDDDRPLRASSKDE